MLGACYCRPWWRSYPQASEVFNDPRTWPRTRRLDALALALVREDAGLPRGTELAAACLLSSLESYRHGALAAYAEAQQLSERAGDLREGAPPRPFQYREGAKHSRLPTSERAIVKIMRSYPALT